MPAAKPKSRLPVIVLIVIVVLVLAGAGAYLLRGHKKPKLASTNHTSSQNVVANNNSTNSSLAHYASNGQDLNLDFDYPAAWTASPPTNSNSKDQTITVTSPLTNLTGTNGSSVVGKSVIYVRPGTASLDELSNGATASQASVQIAYSKPTTSQHQYTYLTFLHLGSGTGNTFQEVVVTGTLQFTANEPVSSSSLTVDPIISASFYTCTTQSCNGSGQIPMSVSNDTWQNTTLFQETLAVFESMQLN